MRIRVLSALICLFAAFLFAAESEAAEIKEIVNTKSGIKYTSYREGTGASPGPSDTVSVNYRGTLPNGREFDSSYKSGRPVQFRLDNVIKCWTEGLQLMKVGGKAELECPAKLAYGDAGIPGSIPAFSSLVFEIELLDVR